MGDRLGSRDAVGVSSIFDFRFPVRRRRPVGHRQAALANVNTRAACSLAGVWRILGTRERTVGVFSRLRLVVFVRLAFSSVVLPSSKRAESIAFVIERVNVVRRVIESRWRRSSFVVVFRENERPTRERRETMRQ